MMEILLLVSALCIDELVASMAYGANGIRLKMTNVLLMNLVSSGFLGAALGFGTLFTGLMEQQTARMIGFVCLFFLGIIKLSDYFIKCYINRHEKQWRSIRFSVSGLRFIISIYADPRAADKDQSNTLSIKETLLLSCAMSIDSLTVGTMAAFLGVSIPASVACSFVVGCICVLAGYGLGKKILTKSSHDLSWIGGVFLLLLALSRL